jgi:pyridoxal phosphate enzyme (YggS family)
VTGASPAAIEERLAAVRARVAAAARRAGRDPAEVTLVGVSKRIRAEAVVAAVKAGLGHVGENYVQEAAAKIAAVAERTAAPPRWHLVGRLQRNKARDAVLLFDLIETLDRIDLARELARRAEAAGRRLPVLLQVNLSREPQKGGVAPEGAEDLLGSCAELPALEVCGLMTVPAADPDPEAARCCFTRLRELREDLRERPAGAGLVHLSMGMSADFEVAVEEGATIVRVGTAIFGARPPHGAAE